MKAISASPKTIKDLFLMEFVIPDYQRPYSWTEVECEQLWIDITDFIDESKRDENYYLGNIVVYKDKNNKSVVVDGQQRITTLLILIKAIYMQAKTYDALDGLLKIPDKKTMKLKADSPIRLKSNVIENDFQSLQSIIYSATGTPKNLFFENYEKFNSLIDLKFPNNTSENKFDKFIDGFLNKIVLLPIECESEDDALRLFETINNRGLQLTDADIFKAKIYNSLSIVDKKLFINDWNDLKNHEWLFRVHMYVDRSKNKSTEKEQALRRYFLSNAAKKLTASKKISNELITALKIYDSIYDFKELKGWIVDLDDKSITNLWLIMLNYPNNYWYYPLYIFLEKNGELKNGKYYLSSLKLKKFKIHFEWVVKYLIVNGVTHNSVNKIKELIFKLCLDIQSDKMSYVDVMKVSILNDIKSFKDKLQNQNLNRYQKTLVFLSSYLYENQNQEDYYQLIGNGRCHIEHILPKKSAHYDGWDSDVYSANINSLGNLLPFEEDLNIKASNDYFVKKCEAYKKSKNSEILKIAKSKNKKWLPSDVSAREKLVIKRLIDYLQS